MENLTYKEKAKEIFDKYYELLFLCETTKNIGKQCAIICVNEILCSEFIKRSSFQVDYWERVKKEIEKL